MFTKMLPLVCVLSQMNSVYNITSCFLRTILILSFHLCLSLPSGLFPSAFTTKNLYAFFFSFLCVLHAQEATTNIYMMYLSNLQYLIHSEESVQYIQVINNIERMHPVVLMLFILLGVMTCFGLTKPSSGNTISNYWIAFAIFILTI
jgi:hypothetical protein